MTTKIEKELIAKPRRSKSAPGKSVSFPVFKTVDDYVLLPKYTYGSDIGLKIGLADRADEVINTAPAVAKERKFGAFIGALRDEQKPGVEKAIKVLQKWNGVTIRGKCGSGKTVAGTYLLWRIKSKRSVVLVDQTNIAEQWAQTIHRHIPEAKISFIMPVADQRKICRKVGLDPDRRTKVDTTGDIVIAMAQTVYININEAHPIPVTLLIVDEAHKFSAPTFANTIFMFEFRYSIGLTATDERPDGLSWVFKRCLGPVVVSLVGRRMNPIVLTIVAPLAMKIDLKDHEMYFCDKIYKMMTRWSCRSCHIQDICTVARSGSKIAYHEVWSRLTNDITYNMFLVQLIHAMWKTGRNVLIFSKFKDHLRNLRNMIIKEIPEEDTALFFGGMDKDKCLAPRLTFTTYKNSEHALDAPHKDASLLAMPITNVEQTTGRIERYREGKFQPVIIDPLIQSVTTFKYQHEKHIRYFRKEGYEIIRCGDPGVALRWLHLCSQGNQ
jgi:superfamily II DNA or RNA helicase